jgi:hypothetical protein
MGREALIGYLAGDDAEHYLIPVTDAERFVESGLTDEQWDGTGSNGNTATRAADIFSPQLSSDADRFVDSGLSDEQWGNS